MKPSALFALVTFSVLGIADASAAVCTSALIATHNVPSRALPAACRALGPFRLGMSYAQMLAKVGPPDANDTPAVGYRDVVYVFPRNLAAELARHPVPPRDVHFGTVEVVFRNGKAVAISAFAPPPVAFSYSVRGVAIGEPVGDLLALVKTPAEWNASKDHVGFGPYPMGVDVGADGRVIGLTIADNMNPNPGHATRFYWTTDPTTGLVHGFHVSVGPRGSALRSTSW